MITRVLTAIVASAALAACQPAVPPTQQGVGFNDSFDGQRRARDAALAGGNSYQAPISTEQYRPAVAPNSAEATAAETTRILNATRPAANTAPVAVNAPPPAAVVGSDGISNENNFDAVSGQRTIEGDAARLAANRAQYQVIQPEALPDRTDAGPNIVAYALNNPHPRGQQVYKRYGINKAAKSARNCAKYSSSDQAQIDFLNAGGPQRDRMALDPDGDGFACDWDPTPFRRAAQSG